ncbi:MAG TPA: saccharopine dehydrogenase NADP-binding domain-containing protein [Thermoanaerobaculia bacterium]|nr:saccharopine dehydrogenase NADP-binding domain-containing protein [Thermoanaerobaculia bacterium]
MRSNLLIYGVTGYTGGLISRLAAAAGLPHLAAGRDLEAVAAHADPLLLPTRTFSLTDPAKVARGLEDAAVLLNAAGPFAETGPPLAEACLRGGVHYLDLAGGVAELEAMRRLDARAREAGVMLMPGVGFAILPTDAVAARLRRRLPAAVRLRLAVEAVGGVSRGSMEAICRDLRRGGGVRRRGGELVPARPGEEQMIVDLGGGPRVAIGDPWRGDLASAWWSSVYPDVEVYTVHPAALRWLLRSRLAAPARALLAGGAGQAVLRRLIALRPPGPDEPALAAGSTRIWAEAEDQTGSRATARLRGPEVHLFTAHTALWVAQRVLAGRLRVGFQTPVTAYGPDLVDRLTDEIEGVELTWS